MYRLRVLVNGRPIPVYQGNDGKQWVEARENTKFEIKVENNSYSRVLAVASVDGLNVINAKHKGPMGDTPGYVINNNSSLSIPGWLVDNKGANEFLFASEKNSYSRKIGADESNIGVIGVAIVSEKSYWLNTTYTSTWPQTDVKKWNVTSMPFHNYGNDAIYSCSASMESSSEPMMRSSLKSSMSSADNLSSTVSSVSSQPQESLSVGSGERTDFATTNVNFEKNRVETTLMIYYDTRANLIKKGIITNEPRPFPISGNYCPDV